MSRHDRFPELLARRAELTAPEEAELRGHLAECPECRRTAAAYEQQTALLRSLPPVDPPPALRAGVLDAIRTAPSVVPWYRRRFALAAPAAAALALVLVAVLWGARPHGGNQTSLRSHPTAGATAAAPSAAGSIGTNPTATPRPASPLSAVKAHPGARPHQRPGATQQHSPTARASRPGAGRPPASQPAPRVSPPLPAATPASGPVLAAGAPPTPTAAVPHAPAGATLPRPTAHGAVTFGAAHPTSRPPARRPSPTARPTEGPVGIAAGPPPTAAAPVAPTPPSAPIRPSPAPSLPTPASVTTPAPATPTTAAAAPVAPVATPYTPLPAIVSSSPASPTPTPTRTPTPTPNP